MEYLFDNLGDVAQVAAVIVAIFILIIEQRKENKYRKIDYLNDYTKRYQEIILNISERILLNDLSLTELNEDEKYGVLGQMRAYLDLCFEEYILYNKKLIENDTWDIWSGGMARAFERKPFIEAWVIFKKDARFGIKFENFIDGLINK